MTAADIAVARKALPEIDNEDRARADFYGLIANLFYAAPSAQLLAIIVAADDSVGAGEGSGFFRSWQQLQRAARNADLNALREEYETLFVGVGRGLVVPYASYYLTGFLMEKPLARLRSDLATLGLARRGKVHEPEDHISALCDVMRLLITGSNTRPAADLQQQREFFDRHLKPWYARLHEDLQKTGTAIFYKAVGDFAQAFFDLEVESFDID
ncbi:MAG: molecular chaperone TorD family protein [Burkholderiales bacterium]|nr:molecular chaperone TorD family protein [Burkholderiales bacterium]